LTGRPAYVGEHVMAVLAKIVLEDAPRVSELRVVPDSLDDLVARTLARPPDQRPRDCLALAAQPATVESLDATHRAQTPAGQVGQAARCALARRAVAPLPPIALATGRGVMAGRWPVGEAIDRAVKMLGTAGAHVRIDDVTAGLLDTRFDIGGDAHGLFIQGE